MRGRKPKLESRGSEIYARLAAWREANEASRPPLRALARELGTSHQLLGFYLGRLDKWQIEQYHRRAEEIRQRATAENRAMTSTEECEVRVLERAAVECLLDSTIRKNLKQIELDAKDGHLGPMQFQFLRLAARHGYPKAQQVLHECGRSAIRERKFAAR